MECRPGFTVLRVCAECGRGMGGAAHGCFLCPFGMDAHRNRARGNPHLGWALCILHRLKSAVTC